MITHCYMFAEIQNRRGWAAKRSTLVLNFNPEKSQAFLGPVSCQLIIVSSPLRMRRQLSYSL